jgi:glycosyltransferase involved in cell wall biosynthesis
MEWQSGDLGHVLIVSHDIVGNQMAGPGIRYYNLARVLSQEFTVLLAVPCEPDPAYASPRLRLVRYARREWSTLEPLLAGARAVILNSEGAGDFPRLADCQIPICVDGYDPLLVEWLALSQLRPQEQEAHWQTRLQTLNRQYLIGDFFVCASERQRDWWLGLLEANGRINPWTWRDDPTLRRLVDVVPFGLPATPPRHTRQVIKGAWPGIAESDRLILWGGGLWPWVDPLTAVRAVSLAWQKRPDLRLVFPGTRHPNPAMANIPTHASAARQLATELGLLDRAVFFGAWVDYPDWPNVLLESDLALSLHFEGTLETRLAFRTRILDYLWAGLPVVATRGDATGDLMAEHNLGKLVAEQEAAAVAEAILELLDQPRAGFEAGFAAARRALTWEVVARPLFDFCRQPRRAADKAALAGQAGNPFYTLQIDRLAQELRAYERRKVVRLLNWLRRYVLFPRRSR